MLAESNAVKIPMIKIMKETVGTKANKTEALEIR